MSASGSISPTRSTNCRPKVEEPLKPSALRMAISLPLSLISRTIDSLYLSSYRATRSRASACNQSQSAPTSGIFIPRSAGMVRLPSTPAR